MTSFHTQLAPKAPNSRGAATFSVAQTPIGQHACLFLNLPRELRDEIYSLLLPSHTTLRFTAPTWATNGAGRFFDIQHDTSSWPLTILAVCQQIHAEASTFIYSTNHFEFSVGHLDNGPSPFNTIRALPQSGISQIKACTIRIFAPTWRKRGHMSTIEGWMDEVCALVKQGGNLQDIEIVLFSRFTSNPDRFQTLLQPLMSLNGLKSVIVKGRVSKAFGAGLKKIMESDATIVCKKRKGVQETDRELKVSARPTKKRQTDTIK
jgi:hypothetical protein